MAERRMLSSKIVCSDAFIEMPFSAQALYVQLVMEADDDGFLNRAKRIQMSIDAAVTDLPLLIEKRFLLAFPNGVVVIKHWRMNNQIRKDRYTPTQYQDEFNSLEIKEDGSYTERHKENKVDSLATTWQPLGNQMATQVSIGKVSIDQYRENIVQSDSDESVLDAQKPTKADVDSFFNAIWDMYPVKKGKAQVSESKRRTLYAIGFENMNKAIERYLAELKRDADWRKPQNGSTFFNSGYVDYLDENFVPDESKHYGRKEKLPGWFGKRELDADELEAIDRLMSEEDQAEADQLRKELQESFGGARCG